MCESNIEEIKFEFEFGKDLEKKFIWSIFWYEEVPNRIKKLIFTQQKTLNPINIQKPEKEHCLNKLEILNIQTKAF